MPFKIAGLVTQRIVCYFDVLGGFCLIHCERPISQALWGIARQV